MSLWLGVGLGSKKTMSKRNANGRQWADILQTLLLHHYLALPLALSLILHHTPTTDYYITLSVSLSTSTSIYTVYAVCQKRPEPV